MQTICLLNWQPDVLSICVFVANPTHKHTDKVLADVKICLTLGFHTPGLSKQNLVLFYNPFTSHLMFLLMIKDISLLQ